jgi:two-component system, chemotaxis family, chemotaxis protein CheY
MTADLTPAGRPASVLVVDDSPTIRMYHRSILAEAGFVVTEAENGYAAFELALQEPFDLLLVDVNMPVLDGYALLARLRAEPACAGIPVIMVSSESEQEDADQAYRLGADLYLVKPVPAELLTTQVTALLPRPRAGSGPGDES